MIKFEGMLSVAAVATLFSLYDSHAGELVSVQPVSITLEECIKNALANNPKVIQSFSTLNLSKATLSEARADYLPQLSTSLGFSHVEASKVSVGAGTLAKKSDTTSE